MTFGASFINFDQFNDSEELRQKAYANAAVGGPNSGFEIEGVDFFKQPALTDQFPEMVDDIDLIVSAESYIQRLVSLDMRIRESKGMCRGMAYELQELIPDLQNFSVRAFTEEVTSVGLQPSLEEISIKIWAMIAAAVAIVLSAIYKFFSWMFGGSSSSGSSTSGSDNVTKNTRLGIQGVVEAEKKLKESAKISKKAISTTNKLKGRKEEMPLPAVVDHEEIERSRMPKPLKDFVIKNTKPMGDLAGQPTALENTPVFDVYETLMNIEGGEMIYEALRNPAPEARIIYGPKSEALDFLLGSFAVFENVAGRMNTQLGVLEDMVEHMPESGHTNDATARMKFDHALNALSETTFSGPGEKIKLKVGSSHREFDKAINWALELKTVTRNPSNFRGFFSSIEELMDDYDRGFWRLSDVDFGGIKVMFNSIEAAQPVLKKLEQIAKSQAARDAVGVATPEESKRAEMVMKLNRDIQADIHGLMVAYDVLGRVFMEVSKNGRNIMKALAHNARAIVKAYERFGKEPHQDLLMAADNLEIDERNWEQQELRDRLLPSVAWVRLKEVQVSINDSDPITMSTDNARKVIGGLVEHVTKKS